ncbi:MAG: hypothetical protein JSW55_18705 [Chloroflexota bacterium]|nr:MAG: hypothetical protein JSW55_18705 [Chloroflexota bacterium]
MLTKTIEPETRTESTIGQVTRLQEVAETIRDNALAVARSRLPARQQEASLADLLQIPAFLNSFKYGLAEGATNVIVANDGNIQAIYLFEESANPDSETEDALAPDLTVHLLLLVDSNSAALEAFIESLDRSLTELLSDLPSPLLAKRTSLLNVIPITQEDVDARQGYGALLSSVFARPVKLWARKK